MCRSILFMEVTDHKIICALPQMRVLFLALPLARITSCALLYQLVLLLTLGNLWSVECSSILSFWRDRDLRRSLHLCPQRWKFLGAVRAGGPLTTFVEPNQTIVLQCRFCEDPEGNEDDDDIGMWTFVDIIRGSMPVRVPRPVDDHTVTKTSLFGFKKPRIVLTERQSLALRKTRSTDLGLYQCQRNGNSPFESPVRFVIDMDIALFEKQLVREKEYNFSELDDEEEEDNGENENSTTENTNAATDDENDLINGIAYINGTSGDWATYRKDHLDRLGDVIAHSNLHLEAMSEWSSWTECRDCWTTKYGVRARRGVCMIRLPLHKTDDEDVVAEELAGLPALACRSAILSRLHPEVSGASRKVPDFLEFDYKGCDGVCGKNSSKSHGSLLHRLVYLFRHRRDAPLLTHRRITIRVGEALIITCPDATAETPVRWEKDGEVIGGGNAKAQVHKRNPVERIITEMRAMEHWVSGQVAGIKAGPDNTPFVDSAGVLKVKSASPRNSGNYECSVNGTPRGSFQVEVIVRSTLSFDDLMRHFAYVSLVLLSCIIIWCGVVICLSLRERFRKNKYTEIPQSGPPARTSFQGSKAETPKSTSEESTLDKESAGTRKTKHQPATHLPSRKPSRPANADSPGFPSPPTSYPTVPSRLRIRMSRLMSRSSASNDIELVRLLPSKSSHSMNYRSDRLGPRTSHRRQHSSASSTSDLEDVEVIPDRGPVIVLSQQLFPASQKALRPPPLSMSLTNQCQLRIHRNSTEPIPTRRVPQSSPSPWVPSTISMSVLRARNSLKQLKTSNSSSKLIKTVHVHEGPMHQQSYGKAATSTNNTRSHKKMRTKRRFKSTVFGKPRKVCSQTKQGKMEKKTKKCPGISSSASSQTRSPVRKRPVTARPKSSSRQISSIKSSVSRLTASSLLVSKQNSLLRSGSSRSAVSPQLSLLYKALPSPKVTASSSNSRDQVSSISLSSNSAGNIAADIQEAYVDKTLESTRQLADVVTGTPAERETNKAPTLKDRVKSVEGNSSKTLSVSTPQSSFPSPFSLKRTVPSTTSYPSSNPRTTTPTYLPPDSYSQQSMFEIKKITEKESQPLELPLPCLSREPPVVLKGPTPQLESCDSVEKLRLVAAFLDTQAHKRCLTPTRSQAQSKDHLPAACQVQLQPKSTRQSYLMPPPVVIASPRQSEISLRMPPPPPAKSSTSSCTKCNVAHAESPKERSIALHHQQMHQKSSNILTTFSRRKSPIQSKPSLQTKPSSKCQNQPITEVSRQLLPALLSPCAIALPDHVPVVNKLIRTGSPLLRKLNSESRTGTLYSSISSIRSSTSTTQSVFNPITDKEKATPHNYEKRSVSPSFTDSASRLRLSVEEAIDEAKVQALQDRERLDTIIRSKSPVRDVTIQNSGGSNVPAKMAETILPETSRCTGSRTDLFADFRESGSEDVFGGSLTRFRTRPETENRGSTYSDWVAAPHKITTKQPATSSTGLSDRLKEEVATTASRKGTPTRFSKHKGLYLRKDPSVDRFQIILVDTDELKKENLTSAEQKESYGKAATTELKSRSRSTVLDTVTRSVTPATAVAIPQMISANLLWPVNTPDSTVRLKSDEEQSLLIRSDPQHSGTGSRSNSEPSQEKSLPPTAVQPGNVVSKEETTTKSPKTTCSKPSVHTVRNRNKRGSHVTMPAIIGPLEFKFKQAAQNDRFSFKANDSENPYRKLSRMLPAGLSVGQVWRIPSFSPELKQTRSLPQAPGSPSLAKRIGTTDCVSKSLGEVKAKPSKPPQSFVAPSPQSFLEDSRFAKLLAREPSTVSSHTTQVEKGDIHVTRDAQVQSVIRSSHTLQENVRDESTSFGSLFERATSRRVRLATNEIASQASTVRTPETPKRTRPSGIPTRTAIKRPQFSSKRRPAATKVASPSNTTSRYPQRNERTNFKSSSPRSQDVTHLSPPCNQSFELPTFKCSSQPTVPPAPPSRLPVPVKKKSAHRVKLEPRAKTPKKTVHPNLKPTRTKPLRKPPLTAAPRHSGRNIGTNTLSVVPRIISPTQQKTPQRQGPIVRQESTASNLCSCGQHHPSSITSPLKSEILRNAEQVTENAKDVERTSAFDDYDSHHTSQSQIISSADRRGDASREVEGSQQERSYGNLLQSQLPGAELDFGQLPLPFSSTLQSDNLKPDFSSALANATQGIMAISMMPTSPFTPVLNQTRISEPEYQSTDTEALNDVSMVQRREKTASETSSRCQSRSNSQPTLRRRLCHQKSTRKQTHRSLTSFPRTSKKDPAKRNLQSRTPTDVFVFQAHQNQQVTSGQNTCTVPLRSIPTFLSDVGNFSCTQEAGSTCPAFLQDGFTSVRALSTVEFEKQAKHEQPDRK